MFYDFDVENPNVAAIQSSSSFPYNFPSDFTSNEMASPASQNDSKNLHMDIPAGKREQNTFKRLSSFFSPLFFTFN